MKESDYVLVCNLMCVERARLNLASMCLDRESTMHALRAETLKDLDAMDIVLGKKLGPLVGDDE